MFKKILENKKLKTYLFYGLLFIATVTLLIFFIKGSFLTPFLESLENYSFDSRQSIASKYKKTNKDIVIISIDDPSYEFILSKFGEWPMPRDVYAKLIDYLEKQHPKAIAFDFMFVKSMKSKTNADLALSKAITKNDNVYVSMNMDYQPFDVRKPEKLPDDLSVDVKNDSTIDYFSNNSVVNFPNCRTILPQILKGTRNIGMINVIRSNDGMLRKIPPFVTYQNKYYPALAMLVGMKYLNLDKNALNNGFQINKDYDMHVGNRTIPFDKDGGVILNWYGPFPFQESKMGKNTFQIVPFYKVYKAMEGDKSVKQYDFRNKIVYVGPTAVSLFDLKSVPVDKTYPGVGTHATFINNLIDNNFIRKVDTSINLLISIILALAVGILVMRTSSTYISLVTTIMTSLGYIVFAYYMMFYFNLWIEIVLPITFIFLMFVTAYIVKYILKSKDFEHQYKLATTDGLTELFNHRYFQEQMIMQIENCKRYNSHFSLILIDIDHFKKFNDVYGHQSGDAVLRQVALKLKKNVRATDIVCRYGGEEMSIILPNTERDEAIITAQKLCQVIAEKPFKLANDQESNVTISLGVATFPEDGETSSLIIESTDKRLYVAKENGRNQVGY